MASQNLTQSLSIMGELITAQDHLIASQQRIEEIITNTPNLYPLAGDVQIDIETALEALQDADISAGKLFNNIQGIRQ